MITPELTSNQLIIKVPLELGQSVRPKTVPNRARNGYY